MWNADSGVKATRFSQNLNERKWDRAVRAKNCQRGTNGINFKPKSLRLALPSNAPSVEKLGACLLINFRQTRTIFLRAFPNPLARSVFVGLAPNSSKTVIRKTNCVGEAFGRTVSYTHLTLPTILLV